MSVLRLARQQRDAQAGLADRLTLELSGMWRNLFGTRAATRADVPDLVDLLTPVVQQYGAASGGVARDFYDQARAEAGETGRFEVPLVDPPPREQIEQSVGWAVNPERHQATATTSTPGDVEDFEADFDRRFAEEMRRIREAEGLTRDPVDDRPGLVDLDDIGERQLNDLTGALPRIARQSGRRTLEQAIDEDPRAVAWARVAGGPDPCAFCVTLISRGWVYRTADTARYKNGTREKYHSLCRCDVVPNWRSKRGELPDESEDAADLWARSGAHFRGKDALNALARALKARREGRDVDDAVFNGPANDPDRYRRIARKGPRGKRKNPAVPGPLPAGDARALLG